MQKKLLVAALGALIAMPALAEESSPFTGNVALTSNYIFRGVSQTWGGPAIQGGFNYTHPSGFYAGVWGSNISWITDFGATGNASIELDAFAGFSNSFAEDFTYDVGLISYNYPGTYTPPAGVKKADTDEIYGSIGYKWLTLKYSRGISSSFLGVPQAQGTNYVELNASVPVADSGFTIGGHVGKQTYKGAIADAMNTPTTTPTYSDYKLDVSKDFGGFTFDLAYTNTNITHNGFYTARAKDLGKSAGILTISRSF